MSKWKSGDDHDGSPMDHDREDSVPAKLPSPGSKSVGRLVDVMESAPKEPLADDEVEVPVSSSTPELSSKVPPIYLKFKVKLYRSHLQNGRELSQGSGRPEDHIRSLCGNM